MKIRSILAPRDSADPRLSRREDPSCVSCIHIYTEQVQALCISTPPQRELNLLVLTEVQSPQPPSIRYCKAFIMAPGDATGPINFRDLPNNTNKWWFLDPCTCKTPEPPRMYGLSGLVADVPQVSGGTWSTALDFAEPSTSPGVSKPFAELAFNLLGREPLPDVCDQD